ncbi:MAG: transporter [Acidimicrobiia bacterium]
MPTDTDAGRDRALRAVERSPQAVAAHDKDAWLAIFAGLSAIEDPVGSRPHVAGVFDARSARRGDGALSRFYDTFIAPNEIAFHVDRDIVCADHVVRDLDIEITMAPRVVVRVPMHLVYELGEEDGELVICRLAAHWELVPMVVRLVSRGPRAWPVGVALGRRMLANLGPVGALGFSSGARSVGRAGRDAVARFAEAATRGDHAVLASLLTGTCAGLEAPYGEPPLTPSELARGPLRRVSVGKLLVSGYAASASVEIEDDAGVHGGVGIFEFDRRSVLMERVRLYWD